MTKPNFQGMVKSVRTAMSKHSPEILTGIGIAGMIATTVLAVKATPKAIRLLDDKAYETHRSIDEIKPMEAVKTCWKCYIPAAVTGTVSTACLIGASSVNARRNAALAAAYTLSDTALREYREKVVETIGEKKEHTIHDKISEKKLQENPIESREVIMVGKGESLFFDPLANQYFRSNVDKIKAAQNNLNEQLLTDAFNSGVSLNDLYRELGIPPIDASIGESIGWNLDIGQIKIHLSAQMINDPESKYYGEACIVLNHMTPPKYGF